MIGSLGLLDGQLSICRETKGLIREGKGGGGKGTCSDKRCRAGCVGIVWVYPRHHPLHPSRLSFSLSLSLLNYLNYGDWPVSLDDGC